MMFRDTDTLELNLRFPIRTSFAKKVFTLRKWILKDARHLWILIDISYLRDIFDPCCFFFSPLVLSLLLFQLSLKLFPLLLYLLHHQILLPNL